MNFYNEMKCYILCIIVEHPWSLFSSLYNVHQLMSLNSAQMSVKLPRAAGFDLKGHFITVCEKMSELVDRRGRSHVAWPQSFAAGT